MIRSLLGSLGFVIWGGLVAGFIPQNVIAQASRNSAISVHAAQETGGASKISWQPNPKKAGLYSALLPGAGQVYNRQYWKAPIIYVGIATSGYFFFFNRDKYQTYRRAYISRIDNDPDTRDQFEQVYSTGSLQQLQDVYKRYLDLTVLFTALGYTIQVLDAVAFAHLRNFDMSPDLSINMQPLVLPNGIVGFSIVARF